MDYLSKYLENISFISWVFNPSSELELIWNTYQTEHPEETKNIHLARKIILQFRTVAKSLSEEEKILLFSRILKQIEERQKSRKSVRILFSIAKYAAVAILFFSIGALLFYRQDTISPAFYSFNSEEKIPGNQAQLIRSNGENLILSSQRSVVSYQKTGELIINEDTLKPVNTDRKIVNTINQLIIPYGKTSEILLPDGTKVFLNAGSRLAYPDQFTGDIREVFLTGEAYFDVKHDSKHTFIVQANGIRIKDLGTRFNVSAYTSDGIIETVLAEGKVSIRKNNSGLFSQSTELIPGQLASFNIETSQISVKSVNVDDYILWTQGLIKFESADFSNLVKKLERFYSIRINYDDPLIGKLKISGKLELKEDRDEVLTRIAKAASVKVINNGDGSYVILK
jgi:hypothetical protein